MEPHAPVERAAGGLVVRCAAGGLEVLLIDDAYGHVAFPKGHLEPGEDWETAAVREIEEETGIRARIISPLGRVEYPITRNGQPVRKQVRLYLMEAVDPTAEPRHQAEELNAAYYLSWPDAMAAQCARGYADWNWVFPKADALWRLHRLGLEDMRRHIATAAPEDILRDSPDAAASLRALADALVAELAAVAPDMAARLSDERLAPPAARAGSEHHDAKHTLHQVYLPPHPRLIDVDHACRMALEAGVARLYVEPQHVPVVSRMLQPARVQTGVVIGLPAGAWSPNALAAQAQEAVACGAMAVAVVLPHGSLMEDDIWTVYQHVRAVTESLRSDRINAAPARPATAGAKENATAGTAAPVVEVVVRPGMFTLGQLAMAARIALAAGANGMCLWQRRTESAWTDAVCLAYMMKGSLRVSAWGEYGPPARAAAGMAFGVGWTQVLVGEV